jgi:hypothetical protein
MNIKSVILITAAICAVGCTSSVWNKPTATTIDGTATCSGKTRESCEVKQKTIDCSAACDDDNSPDIESTAIIDNEAKQSKEADFSKTQQEAKPIEQKNLLSKMAQTKEIKPADEEESKLLFTSDGRLMHPWHNAPEIKNYESQKPNWFGESLKFKIGWSFITAGEAELLANKIIDAGGGPAFAVEAYAQSYSVIDKLFKVRDINISWISADFTKSLGYWQSVREGRYSRDEWLIFDYKNKSYTVHKQNNKKELSREPLVFSGSNVWDMLSALYFVRTQPLPLNETIYFDIVNVKKQYPLKVTVRGRETVKVKAGKFDCIVVEPAISGEGIFISKGKSLKVWLTDDSYRMPVKMSAEVFIGSVYAELVSFERDIENLPVNLIE